MPSAEPSDDDPELIATTDGRVPGRRGLATRQRLLECTAELLVATPWRSIKVIDIAREAGTSPATYRSAAVRRRGCREAARRRSG